MALGQPTVSEIRSAKSKAVGGGRKRCRRGKNCSAACIQAGMDCLVEMPESVGVALGKVSSSLRDRAPSVPSAMKKELAALGGAAPKSENELAKWGTDQLQKQRKAAWALGKDDKVAQIDSELARRGGGNVLDVGAKTVGKSITAQSASGGTRYDRGDAKDFDFDLTSGQLRRVGDRNYYGWDDSYGSGSKTIGAGSYGTVMRNKDGTFVKRGAISDTEAELIDALGKVGLGPKLVAADINGKHPWYNENFVDIRKGRIAMGEVAGNPVGDVSASTKIAGKPVPDVYWKALGRLHKLGIAHNDAHIDNILVDDKGTGRWVDLGLAQKSPKAALAEALGSFSGKGNTRTGNWQTRRWGATGIKEWENAPKTKEGAALIEQQYPVLGRVLRNRGPLFNELRRYGLTTNDYAQMSDTPIRSPLSVYEQGPWAKLTDAQAQNLLNILYDGV